MKLPDMSKEEALMMVSNTNERKIAKTQKHY
jgi:hypothetical protein